MRDAPQGSASLLLRRGRLASTRRNERSAAAAPVPRGNRSYSTGQRRTKLPGTPGDATREARPRGGGGPGRPQAAPAGPPRPPGEHLPPPAGTGTNLSGPRSAPGGSATGGHLGGDAAPAVAAPARAPSGPHRLRPAGPAAVPASATAGNSRGAGPARRLSRKSTNASRDADLGPPVLLPLQRALAAPGRREAAPPPDREKEGGRAGGLQIPACKRADYKSRHAKPLGKTGSLAQGAGRGLAPPGGGGCCHCRRRPGGRRSLRLRRRCGRAGAVLGVGASCRPQGTAARKQRCENRASPL